MMQLENWGVPKEHMEIIRPCIILDDLQGSPIFNNTGNFRSTVLRMRHLGSDPQIGASFFVITQSLRAGFPRSLRSTVGLWFLFGTKDRTVIRDIAMEVSGRVSLKQFQKMFAYATEERPGNDHPFLTIDLTQRDESRVFRRKLEEYLNPRDFDE